MIMVVSPTTLIGGTAAGPLVVFGHETRRVGGGGLVLSITSLIAGMVYAASAGPITASRLRQIQA
jgi:hypothetical protein